MARTYREIRKTYITARVEEPHANPPRGYSGNWRKYYKDAAMSEFDEFVAAERRAAVIEYKTLHEYGLIL